MFDDSDKAGYVYLINAIGTNRYKIGRTLDLKRRVSQLNYQSSYPLKIVLSFKSYYPAEDEKALHKKFASYRVHGEWFEFSFVDATEFYSIMHYRKLANWYISGYQDRFSMWDFGKTWMTLHQSFLLAKENNTWKELYETFCELEKQDKEMIFHTEEEVAAFLAWYLEGVWLNKQD
jgi:hypothetical protein